MPPVPWTADHRHLALVGIAASAMVADARELAGVYLTPGQPTIFELPGHGFDGAAGLAGAERIRFGARTNGVQLDTAIVPTSYYDVSTIPGDQDFFTLSLAGTPLILSGDGIGLPFTIENIVAKLDIIMAEWTSKVVANAKAYKAPWYVPPGWAPLLIATLAAPTVVKVLRVANARFPVDDVSADYDRAMKQYDDLGNGVPFDDGTGPVDADSIPNDTAIATNSIVQGRVCPIPWLSGYL